MKQFLIFTFIACLVQLSPQAQTVLHLDNYTMGKIDNAVTTVSTKKPALYF